MALIILAALAGLFGSGGLSQARAGDPSSQLWLEYHRFERTQSATTVHVHIPSAENAEIRRIWLSRNYLQGVKVEQVTPPPETVEAAADRLIYSFRVAPSDQPTTIVFHLNPEFPGILAGTIGVEDGPELSFNQLVYP
jgi:hypothetical protein